MGQLPILPLTSPQPRIAVRLLRPSLAAMLLAGARTCSPRRRGEGEPESGCRFCLRSHVRWCGADRFAVFAAGRVRCEVRGSAALMDPGTVAAPLLRLGERECVSKCSWKRCTGQADNAGQTGSGTGEANHRSPPWLTVHVTQRGIDEDAQRGDAVDDAKDEHAALDAKEWGETPGEQSAEGRADRG